jgi:prephenate dehydratase
VADALAGLHRISPATRFLGSYGRADEQSPVVAPHTSDEAFRAAHAWVGEILAAENVDSSMARNMAQNASPTA